MTASARIEDLKKRYDENPRRFFAPLANEYRKAGDLDQAIALCQTHLAEQPSNMNGHVVFAQALYDAGRYDEAQTTFETALTLDPENLIALRHLGNIACARGANDEAREWYERVLDADPRNGEIIALLANLAAEEQKATVAAPVVTSARTTASDPTPIMPIEAVTTVRAPVSSAQAALPAEAPEPMDPALDAVFADAEEIHFGTPPDSVPAVPVWPAPPANDEPVGAHQELTSDSFAEPEQTPEPPAEPFVTETMAELYLQQGFAAEALDVYRQLLSAAPGNAALGERVRRLERGDRTPLPQDWAPAAEPEPVTATDFAPEPAPSTEAEPPAFAASETVLSIETEPAVAPEPEPVAWTEPEPAALTEREPVASTEPEPVAWTEPESAPPVPSARSYFSALAARRAVQGSSAGRDTPHGTPAVSMPAQADAPRILGLNELFAGSPISPDDERIALAISQVAGAAEMGNASVRGKPTAAAETELSLDAVFRESEPRVSGAVSRQSQTLRFDQFFAATGEASDARTAESSAPAGEPGSPAELQQFQSWLTRLKQP